jgi:CheY-like chemotaxis protein
MMLSNNLVEILLAEDNPADADLFLEAAEDIGLNARVNVASDGDEFFTMLRGYDEGAAPHLILLDLNLPRMNGLEILSRLKSDPRWKTIPVLILSTSAARRDIDAAYERNANAYLVKPMDYESYRHLLSCLSQFWFDTACLPVG